MRSRYCEERCKWRSVLAALTMALAFGLAMRAPAQLSTTTVQGTIYRADGTPASGTLLLSWPAFTTPQNQAVAAGSLNAAIGADGFVSVNLTPNAGALPAGSYYTVVYQLSDGTVSQEYWVVPASGTASVASVRAELEPSTVAVQPTVTSEYVTSAVASMASAYLPLAGGTLSGPLTLNADPMAAGQAATKHYADLIAAQSLPLSGGALSGPLTVPGLSAKQLEGVLYADQWSSSAGSNNGIAMSLQECASLPYACQVLAPPLYAAAEQQPWGGNPMWYSNPLFEDAQGPPSSAPQGCVTDDRFGGQELTCTATPAPSWAPQKQLQAGGFSIAMNNTWHPGGNWGMFAPALTIYHNTFAGGFNFSNDQASNNALRLQQEEFTGGSNTALALEALGESNGDHIGIQILNLNRGGTSAGDNEGVENKFMHQEAPDVYQGTVNSITPQSSGTSPCTGPCVVFNTTQAQGYKGGLGAGLALIDLTQGYGSNLTNGSGSYISSISSAGVVTASNFSGNNWDAAFGDSNAHTTTTAPVSQCSAANCFPQTSVAVSVTSASGFTTSSPACIFDQTGLYWECEKLTSVNAGANTLTFAVLDQPFLSGSIVAQGGMTGMGLELVADEVNPSNLAGLSEGSYGPAYLIRSVVPIEYNSSGNQAQMLYGSHYGFNGNSTRAYNQMGSGGTVTATVSGGAVTSCTASGGSGYSAQTDAFGHLYDPPQLSSAVNAGATAPVLSITSASASSGALSGCAVQSGGSGITSISVAVTPANAYAVYPMTHTINVWNPTTGAVDGSSIATDQPAGTFNTGDTVEQEHYFHTQYKGTRTYLYQYQPGAGALTGNEVFFGGVFPFYNEGQSAAFHSDNTDNASLFLGYPAGSTPWTPGQSRMSTPWGYYLEGPHANAIFQQIPAFGAVNGRYAGEVAVGCINDQGQNVCANWNTWSILLNHSNQQASGSASDVLEYNPTNYTWQWTAGASGSAGYSPYCTVNLAGASGGGLSIACNGYTSKFDTSGDLSLPGSLHAQGAVTGASINGEITVDGTTYTTLNAAWNAAVSQANTTGQNQTIRLGPGTFPVSATLTEPANGACVSVLGSGGTTMNADSPQVATTLTVPASLNGDVFFLGNTAQAQGCTFRDLNLLAQANATHGFELQWFRGALIDNVTVNDTTAEGILLGEENTSGGHESNFLVRNTTVSYSSATFTPASRPAYGIHLQKTAMDSHLDDIVVRNALTAAIDNEGTGNTGYLIHGFGYPYTCTTAPCANNASSQSAANASWATNYVIYDTGGSGSVWTDTYADSPAIAGFYIGANGIAIHGGHIQWPDLTSFPAANLAYVAATVTNNLLIADVDCLEMNSSANWITYAGTAGDPPTFASVHHLSGCGNYYQALEPAQVTGFSSGGANIADGSSAVPRVWSTPIAAAASYPAFAAQLYTGYQGDAFQAHFSGQNPFFNVTYQGTIRSSGGIALSTVINTASTLTLTAANKNVIANAAGGAQVLTLPSCYAALPDRASPTGLEFTIVKSDTSSNTVTLQTTSSQLIYSQGASAATLVLSSPSTQTLVCGPDNNWYVVGSAAATVSQGSGVASFNGRTGAVTPASGDYSFSQIGGQATNAQLPATLSAPTTGNAATATALAAAPAQCPTGYYSTGITASGVANCLQSWRFTWYGYFGGSFATSTNNSLGSVWTPSAALTMTRLDIAVGTAPAGCTTWPVIGIYDATSSTWLKTVTLASGTYAYRNAVSGVSIVAGHNLSMGVQTAGAGCTTSAQNAQLTMEYTMNQ